LLELNAATAFAKALNARGEAAYAKSILGPVVSAFPLADDWGPLRQASELLALHRDDAAALVRA